MLLSQICSTDQPLSFRKGKKKQNEMNVILYITMMLFIITY